MLVKVLGAIDLISSITFMMLIFGITPFTSLILFCAALLFLKGLFIFTGDVLSIIDLLSAIALIASIFFTLPSLLLWAPAFLLLAKAVVSFV